MPRLLKFAAVHHYDPRDQSVVYFAQDPQFTRNVLGRTGWLDRFRVALNHPDISAPTASQPCGA